MTNTKPRRFRLTAFWSSLRRSPVSARASAARPRAASLSPAAKRNARLMKQRNNAAARRRAAMTRENALYQQIVLAAFRNSLKRPVMK